MGTKVQCKSYLPGYYSMRDLNEDSNSCSWPLYYGDKSLTNGQYYNGFMQRAVSETYSGYDKDAVKQKMLEHEAIFKNQVCELHRLYRIQRDLMEEVKRKELRKNLIAAETSLSSSPLNSQITSEDARKWHIPSLPLPNSVCAKPSISGAEDIHSPLSSMKGSSRQAGPLPFQNGDGSKDVELLESRPTKVRRKMIDLQLPADEYIDTEDGEQFRDETISGMPNYLCNGNQKMVAESGAKLCVGSSKKSGCPGDDSRSDSFLRSTNSVADLNEPIPAEETNNSRYLDLLGHASRDGENEGRGLFAKPKSQLQGFPKEISLNSHYGSNNGTADNRHLENNENGGRWLSHVLEAGSSKSSLKSASQGLQHEKSLTSSQPIQVLFNKAHEAPNFLLTNPSKVDMWRERNHEISNNIHPESGVASNMSSSYPIASSSDLFNSWPHSVSSCEKPSSSLSQRSISVQTPPFLNSSGILSRTAQTPAQTYGIFGDGWHLNSHPRSTSSFESELPSRNGFYYGSSSASKEPLVQVPSISYNYLNCSNENNVASEHTVNRSAKLYMASSSMDMKSAKDVNLNVVFSPEAVPQQSIEIKDGERKNEDRVAMLPWLRAKPSCKNEATITVRDLNVGELSFLQSSLNQSVNKNETENSQIVAENLKSGSGSNNIEASRIERSDFSNNKKILGFPIFENPHISKNESSSLTSPSEVEVDNNRKNRVFDMNLPCDAAVPDLSQKSAEEAPVIEKKSDVKDTGFRHYIDLNSYVSEDETSLIPTVLSTSVKTLGIDLEAPIVLETEEDVIHEEENPQKAQEAPLQSPEGPEHKTERLQDEIVRIAAEAIVFISSSSLHDHRDETVVAISSSNPHNPLDDAACNSSEASVKDPLNWFVEIVSCCGNELESRIDAFLRGKDGEDNEESLSEEFDYFESMTLKITETTEEEYMPTPLVPENFKVEEAGTTVLPNRQRKGQARRGRQRRDFQRDILPGLASLSRHEVTEDLQTFGGLMRATGHSWHSGLTRRNSTRNGCGRGRRRAIVSSPPPPPPPPVAVTTTCTPLVQQLTNVEVGLEDRSLTGWGKTTRRPRRQRCPAGNAPAIAMT
ncbi:hypothetical protein Dsin_009944 [Dipteronia sinensis]|uniref:Uncharacterized protein n=1 Tax=Dipteronia sinensis TaxID=43782 RepID=A0AAE0ASR6_9ROSI|nr:hypothetical protein Dsin_009944 [Dipteronia sinensis]